MKRSQVIAAFEAADSRVYADKVIIRRDGTGIARRGFFYTHGRTSRDFAEAIEASGFTVVSHREVWQAWPRDSYWEVVFTD